MGSISAMLMVRSFIQVIVVGFCLMPVFAKETVRILFIGNSYTGQIKKAVSEMIAASPHGGSTELKFITPGGRTLEQHLGNESTLEAIDEGNWDYVVLQDQSQTPAVFPRRFEAVALEFDKRIDAAGSKTVFYQTWGRRDGDKQNSERFPDYGSMQEALSKSYSKAARRCDAILVPVGEVWSAVLCADAVLGRELYKGDGSHPSAKGAYLAACVFYEGLFKQSASDIDFGKGVSEAERESIHRAVRKILSE